MSWRERRGAAVLALAICWCVSGVAHAPADETPLVGIGGAYRPMQGESTVRLVRETINVRFSPRTARTAVQFEFRNEGPAQAVTMGFPERVVYDRGRYRRFRAELDGKPLAASPTRWVEKMPRTLWTRWWVSMVRFERGQVHRVRVAYEERPARDSYGAYTYRYLFGTGRPWKGSIGSVEMTVTLEGFPAEATVHTGTPGATREGNRIAWAAADWEPEPEANLDLLVWPCIVQLRFDKGMPDPPMEVSVRRGHADAYLWEIAFWTDVDLAWHSDDQTAYAHRDGRTLALRVGAREAMALPTRTPVRLPFAPYLKDGRMRVPLRAVCESLGLQVGAGKDELGNWIIGVTRAE